MILLIACFYIIGKGTSLRSFSGFWFRKSSIYSKSLKFREKKENCRMEKKSMRVNYYGAMNCFRFRTVGITGNICHILICHWMCFVYLCFVNYEKCKRSGDLNETKNRGKGFLFSIVDFCLR